VDSSHLGPFYEDLPGAKRGAFSHGGGGGGGGLPWLDGVSLQDMK
jgi:hypothetical protein